MQMIGTLMQATYYLTWAMMMLSAAASLIGVYYALPTILNGSKFHPDDGTRFVQASAIPLVSAVPLLFWNIFGAFSPMMLAIWGGGVLVLLLAALIAVHRVMGLGELRALIAESVRVASGGRD